MNKPTPGPWMLAVFGENIQGDEEQHEICAYVDDKPVTVAFVNAGTHVFSDSVDGTYHTISKAEAIANARVLSAAHDMLDALRKAVVLLAGVGVHAAKMDPSAETYKAVSAAIAKATGASE